MLNLKRAKQCELNWGSAWVKSNSRNSTSAGSITGAPPPMWRPAFHLPPRPSQSRVWKRCHTRRKTSCSASMSQTMKTVQHHGRRGPAGMARTHQKSKETGSPAMAGKPVTGKCLPVFMNKNSRIDFIAVHWHSGADLDKFIDEIKISAALTASHSGWPNWPHQLRAMVVKIPRDSYKPR